jgi:phosphatidylinositol 3-kinase
VGSPYAVCVHSHSSTPSTCSPTHSLTYSLTHTGIEGFGDETERVIVLAKVQEKFKLQLNDEQAGNYILELIDSSVNALFPKLVERIHGMAMYFK